MSDVELIRIVDRLKRAQPRNQDALTVCDALLARLSMPGRIKQKRAAAGTFDRRAYQRELMRKRRAEGKA